MLDNFEVEETVKIFDIFLSNFTNGDWFISQKTRHCWYNIVPITFQIYVVYGQETRIYTVFNLPKGICTAANVWDFVSPFTASYKAQTRIYSFEAWSKYGRCRKYVILWVGQPNCFCSIGYSTQFEYYRFIDVGQSTCNL